MYLSMCNYMYMSPLIRQLILHTQPETHKHVTIHTHLTLHLSFSSCFSSAPTVDGHLLIDGYRFVVSFQKQHRCYLKCSRFRSKCRARAIRNKLTGQLEVRNGEHNHNRQTKDWASTRTRTHTHTHLSNTHTARRTSHPPNTPTHWHTSCIINNFSYANCKSPLLFTNNSLIKKTSPLPPDPCLTNLHLHSLLFLSFSFFLQPLLLSWRNMYAQTAAPIWSTTRATHTRPMRSCARVKSHVTGSVPCTTRPSVVLASSHASLCRGI